VRASGDAATQPPFPVEHGFLGEPTAVNNVETFAAASRIMRRVPGVRGNGGTRVNRHPAAQRRRRLRRPRIYEVEWGVTLREVLDMVGADNPRAVQISGPSGEMLSVAADATAGSPLTICPATAPSWCSTTNVT